MMASFNPPEDARITAPIFGSLDEPLPAHPCAAPQPMMQHRTRAPEHGLHASWREHLRVRVSV